MICTLRLANGLRSQPFFSKFLVNRLLKLGISKTVDFWIFGVDFDQEVIMNNILRFQQIWPRTKFHCWERTLYLTNVIWFLAKFAYVIYFYFLIKSLNGHQVQRSTVFEIPSFKSPIFIKNLLKNDWLRDSLANCNVQIIFTRINSILVAKAVLYYNRMRTRQLNSAINMTFNIYYDIYYVIMSNRFS